MLNCVDGIPGVNDARAAALDRLLDNKREVQIMPVVKNPLPLETYEQRKRRRREDVRGPYFRDQTAIIHSTPFRRLKHKTQFFYSPKNDHVCTRIEHVIHVATIAATICKGLSQKGWELNSELAYAIGLGHDLGHAPFGHAGEEALDKCLKPYGKAFVHEVNSYRVVEHLSEKGCGLNLTYGVKDGIITHNGEKFERTIVPCAEKKDLELIKDRSCMPSSYEGCIVRFSDKIAYLGRDMEDAIMSGLVKSSDVPPDVKKILGRSNSSIINTLVLDMIKSSAREAAPCFSEDKFQAVRKLKEFNYMRIYDHKLLLEYKTLCQNAVRTLFEHLLDCRMKFGNDYNRYRRSHFQLDRTFGHYLRELERFYSAERSEPYQTVVDYISGMTDTYALEAFTEIAIPKPIIVD